MLISLLLRFDIGWLTVRMERRGEDAEDQKLRKASFKCAASSRCISKIYDREDTRKIRVE